MIYLILCNAVIYIAIVIVNADWVFFVSFSARVDVIVSSNFVQLEEKKALDEDAKVSCYSIVCVLREQHHQQDANLGHNMAPSPTRSTSLEIMMVQCQSLLYLLLSSFRELSYYPDIMLVSLVIVVARADRRMVAKICINY